jgi:hypothetical protein
MHFFYQSLDIHINGAVRPLQGKAAQILCSSESTGKHQRIEIGSLDFFYVFDIPSRDAGRLDKDISLLAGGFTLHVVYDIRLIRIRGHTDYLRPRLVKIKQRQGCLMDFGTVEYSAT